MLEYFYRLRNKTLGTYEYIWQDATLPAPTVLPDHPNDNCDTVLTAIINQRTV